MSVIHHLRLESMPAAYRSSGTLTSTPIIVKTPAPEPGAAVAGRNFSTIKRVRCRIGSPGSLQGVRAFRQPAGTRFERTVRAPGRLGTALVGQGAHRPQATRATGVHKRPGKGCVADLGVEGPTAAAGDRSWKPGDIEKELRPWHDGFQTSPLRGAHDDHTENLLPQGGHSRHPDRLLPGGARSPRPTPAHHGQRRIEARPARTGERLSHRCQRREDLRRHRLPEGVPGLPLGPAADGDAAMAERAPRQIRRRKARLCRLPHLPRQARPPHGQCDDAVHHGVPQPAGDRSAGVRGPRRPHGRDAAKDSQGHWLDGAKTYRLKVPKDVPAAQFWSVTVYDNETRCFVKSGAPPDRSSRDPIVTNADG